MMINIIKKSHRHIGFFLLFLFLLFCFVVVFLFVFFILSFFRMRVCSLFVCLCLQKDLAKNNPIMMYRQVLV